MRPLRIIPKLFFGPSIKPKLKSLVQPTCRANRISRPAPNWPSTLVSLAASDKIGDRFCQLTRQTVLFRWINHSIVADRVCVPSWSCNSTAIEIIARRFNEKSASNCARDSEVTLAVEAILPLAGLRNFASRRRTPEQYDQRNRSDVARIHRWMLQLAQAERVDCAEMIEIPITGGKSQHYTLVSSFDTEKPVEW